MKNANEAPEAVMLPELFRARRQNDPKMQSRQDFDGNAQKTAAGGRPPTIEIAQRMR